MTTSPESRPAWRGLYRSPTPERDPRPGYRVVFDNGTAFLSGPTRGAVRKRITLAGDRSPVWVPRTKVWATSTGVGARVLDQLERHGIAAVVEDVDQFGLDLSHTQPANSSDTQGGLW